MVVRLDISLSPKFVSRELDKTYSVIRSRFRDVISDDYKDLPLRSRTVNHAALFAINRVICHDDYGGR